jgi:hypothetical protein
LSPHLSRAGLWFLRSGIQESNGGVARFYLADRQRNRAVSTEITGYAISALIYLHQETGDARYLDAAVRGARFLTGVWNSLGVMPFETDPGEFSYFFDCGIIVRGLLSVWRVTGEAEFLKAAAGIGDAMAADFVSAEGDFHPILALPGKQPEARDELRWSRTSACYQLKSAMAWRELAEATGRDSFREPYRRAVEFSLRGYESFLPGHPDRFKVMDRLHAFSYFLEGLLPCADDPRCAAAISDGILRAAGHLRAIAPDFARSDVFAQLLRIRIYADRCGAAPLNEEAAAFEAAQLAGFQAESADPRIDGGFYFGRKDGAWLPHVNPVSAAFALQALALWERRGSVTPPHWHSLI